MIVAARLCFGEVEMPSSLASISTAELMSTNNQRNFLDREK